MLKSLLIAGLLLVCGCRNASQTVQETVRQSADSVVGTWKLKSVGGADPSSINIRVYEIAFAQDGTWTYTSTMSGAYEGMQMNGSGAWSLKGDKLEYTAGDNKGATRVRISNDSLALQPDPVLRRKGTEEVEAIYARDPLQNSAPNSPHSP